MSQNGNQFELFDSSPRVGEFFSLYSQPSFQDLEKRDFILSEDDAREIAIELSSEKEPLSAELQALMQILAVPAVKAFLNRTNSVPLYCLCLRIVKTYPEQFNGQMLGMMDRSIVALRAEPRSDGGRSTFMENVLNQARCPKPFSNVA